MLHNYMWQIDKTNKIGVYVYATHNPTITLHITRGCTNLKFNIFYFSLLKMWT